MSAQSESSRNRLEDLLDLLETDERGGLHWRSEAEARLASICGSAAEGPNPFEAHLSFDGLKRWLAANGNQSAALALEARLSPLKAAVERVPYHVPMNGQGQAELWVGLWRLRPLGMLFGGRPLEAEVGVTWTPELDALLNEVPVMLLECQAEQFSWNRPIARPLRDRISRGAAVILRSVSDSWWDDPVKFQRQTDHLARLAEALKASWVGVRYWEANSECSDEKIDRLRRALPVPLTLDANSAPQGYGGPVTVCDDEQTRANVAYRRLSSRHLWDAPSTERRPVILDLGSSDLRREHLVHRVIERRLYEVERADRGSMARGKRISPVR